MKFSLNLLRTYFINLISCYYYNNIFCIFFNIYNIDIDIMIINFIIEEHKWL